MTWVHYPGLLDHPQHEIAKRQINGFGAMICFGVKNGLDGGKTVMNNVHLFTHNIHRKDPLVTFVKVV